MKDATYIKVKEGKLWASDEILYTLNSVRALQPHPIETERETYGRLMEAFNQSFIEVGNPEFALGILYISDPQKAIKVGDLVTGMQDGLYPISGLQFEVREMAELNRDGKKFAILSLKQEQPSEEKEDYEDLAKTLHGRIRATDQEYIICAAVHFESNKVQAHQPKNITHGLVVCGRRHHNCFATVYGFGDKLKEIEQGFVTSKDRFVDRKEAGEIAFKAGQTNDLRTCLFSEDLY